MLELLLSMRLSIKSPTKLHHNGVGNFAPMADVTHLVVIIHVQLFVFKIE